MKWLLTAVMVVGFAWAVWTPVCNLIRAARERRLPVHVWGDLVLPLPDDPRWEVRGGAYWLDDVVRVKQDQWFRDSWEVDIAEARFSNTRADRYGAAVAAAYKARLAVIASEHARRALDELHAR